MIKKLFTVTALLAIALSACGTGAATEPPASTATPPPATDVPVSVTEEAAASETTASPTDSPAVTDTPDQVDVNVSVTEKPTGSVQLGAGFSQDNGFALSASISQSNFFGSGKAVSAVAAEIQALVDEGARRGLWHPGALPKAS